jgi:hypothetical protein
MTAHLGFLASIKQWIEFLWFFFWEVIVFGVNFRVRLKRRTSVGKAVFEMEIVQFPVFG